MSHRMLPLVVALVTGSCLLASPVHAAGEIGLSNDGVTWSSSLERPLFDPAFRWVPGDSENASFYVRNQGPSSALLTIEARSPDTDELLDNDDIALRVRAADGEWVAIEHGVASRSLTSRAIRRGGVVEVDVNATFEPASTNQSQTKRLALTFEVTLADSLETGGRSPAGNVVLLPGAGSRIALWVLLVAALLVGSGVAIVRRRGPGNDRG